MQSTDPAAATPLPIELDGHRIEAVHIGPPPDAAPTLVLLHEGLGCVALWRDFPARLAAHLGCGVLAYSRFGYGQSAGEPLPWPVSYLHDHARDILPRVIEAAGLRRFFLLGHSDGGSIAAIAAADAPDPRCAGLILIAAHYFVEEKTIAAIRAARVAYDQGKLRARLARYHRNVENAFLGWNDAWLNPAFRALDLSPQLRRLRVPVLGLQGENDEYGTGAQLDLLHRQAGGGATTQLIPGAGHALHEQAAPAMLIEIDRFLQNNAGVFS